MDEKGKLYGEPDRNNEGTVFAEHAEVSFLLQKNLHFQKLSIFLFEKACFSEIMGVRFC